MCRVRIEGTMEAEYTISSNQDISLVTVDITVDRSVHQSINNNNGVGGKGWAYRVESLQNNHVHKNVSRTSRKNNLITDHIAKNRCKKQQP